MMIAFVKRNLALFFESKSNVFFSLMGALIAFVLYLAFLKNQMVGNLPFGKVSSILDPWLIGGTLSVTAITTTQNALGQMIVDRQSGTLADLAMTEIPFWQLQLGYFLSALMIGMIMQVFMFAIMYGYFAITDGISVPWELSGQLFGLMGLSSLVWTAFNLMCLSFVKKVETLGQLSTIVGTAAGFFAGVYMPIGVVPKVAQTLMKFTPAPYNAALFRHILLQKVINRNFSGASDGQQLQFEKNFGIRLNLNGVLSTEQILLILGLFLISFISVALILMKRSRCAALTSV